MKTRIAMVIASVFLSTVHMEASAYDGWSGTHQIDSIRTYPDGGVLITMANAANPSGCSSTDYISLPQDGSEGRKKQYATLLSAYMARDTVALAFTGCTGGGTTGYRVIEQVWLKR